MPFYQLHVDKKLQPIFFNVTVLLKKPRAALQIKYFYPLLLTLPAFTRKPLLPQSGPLKGMQRSDPNAAYSLEQPPQPNHRPICKKWMLIFIAHWIFVVACYTARGDRYIYTWICVHIVHVPIVQDTYLWVRHEDNSCKNTESIFPHIRDSVGQWCRIWRKN